MYHIKQLNSLNGENEVRRTESSHERNFSGSCQIISRVVSGRLTNCLAPTNPENKIAHLYDGRSPRREKESRLARTINFSTSRFENSSRGRTHLRISITCPKNRAAAYPFLFPRRSIYP